VPSSHLSLHYHVIFSTKARRRLILPAWKAELHAYLGGIVRTIGGVPEEIGGTDDHVHLLIGLKATHQLSSVLCRVKQGSSEWIHKELGHGRFDWQDGYGAFSVSASDVPRVRQYIAHQEEHHRKRTFEEEYMVLLKGSGVSYDERYLW
jgi:putative transposase